MPKSCNNTADQLPYVALRAMEPEDLDTLYNIENDFELWNVGSTNVPYSRYALHEYIANASGDIYTDRQVRLMITGSRGETIGIIDLVNFNPQHQRAEVGIVIQKLYRDQGYGRAAMHRLIDYAHSVLHIHQLYALISVDNASCIKLFEHLGFQKGVELRDWLYDGDVYHDAVVMQTFF